VLFGSALGALLLASTFAAAGTPVAVVPPTVLPALAAVPARELRVTLGQLEQQSGAPLPAGVPSHRFFVRSPALRAWLGRSPPHLSRDSSGVAASAAALAASRAEPAVVELEFVYHGPSRGQAPLASGELRRQVGVELRAQDGCNLVYVMWRIEPVQKLMVSLKSNPGQHSHRECGDRGYVNLVPERAEPLPPLRVGESHVLRASASASELTVWVDGRRRWQGRLPAAAAAFDGPAGVRSDNVELELLLRSSASLGPAQASVEPAR
jgi:hypothetical protein